jgi:hypothetical protein
MVFQPLAALRLRGVFAFLGAFKHSRQVADPGVLFCCGRKRKRKRLLLMYCLSGLTVISFDILPSGGTDIHCIRILSEDAPNPLEAFNRCIVS